MRIIKYLSNIFIVSIIIFIFSLNSYALEKKSHTAINEYIAENTINSFSFDQYLRDQLGFKEGIDTIIKQFEAQKIDNKPPTIFNWLGYGGKKEDIPVSRSFRHYHNPLETWDKAGYKGMWESSIIWAQTYNPHTYYQHYSWQDARDYFHWALTSEDQTERDYYFAKMFRTIGQVMHLVEDSSVPLHTRNDTHVFFHYEYWVEKTRQNESGTFYLWLSDVTRYGYDKSILGITPNPLAPIPIARIVDTDKYHQNGDNPEVTLYEPVGIAEYSNANFFSTDTRFENFPHPNWDNVQAVDFEIKHPLDQSHTVVRPYYWKNIDPPARDGDTGYRLAAVGLLLDYAKRHFPGYINLLRDWERPALDANVYSDYAERLIPRAVGYSASLLAYFFRGTIEISIPDDGFYGITDDPAAGFTSIKFKAKNTTEDNEEMTNGTIELVVKYRLSQGNPFTNAYSNTSEEFYYIVAPEQSGVSSIPRNDPVELSFDLSGDNAIPLWATDLYLYVVFKGKLGNEDNAIAVGFKDISEPTPIDLYNNMDKICFNGVWETAGSSALIAYVDNPAHGGNDNGVANEYDVYAHNLKDVYYRFYPPGQEPQYPSPTEHHHYLPGLEGGAFNRSIYVLTDYEFNYTFLTSVETTDANDPWDHLDQLYIIEEQAIKNQYEWTGSDYERCTPGFYPFRGVEIYRGIIMINWPYPDPNDYYACPYENLE